MMRVRWKDRVWVSEGLGEDDGEYVSQISVLPCSSLSFHARPDPDIPSPGPLCVIPRALIVGISSSSRFIKKIFQSRLDEIRILISSERILYWVKF
jgi:hypothetical protein